MGDLRAMDDASLLAALDPDGEAFRIFYERHAPRMMRFFARRGLSDEDAADLTQETFAAALSTRDGYRKGRGTALGWLFGIANKKLADRARAWHKEQATVEGLSRQRPHLTDGDSAGYAAIAADEAAAQALGALPPDQRDTVRAKVIEQQDYKDIASAYGISESSARQRVSRGLRSLRRHFEEEGP